MLHLHWQTETLSETMKTKYIIIFTLITLLFVCGQNASAQYYPKERTPVLDTSKIDYEIVNPRKIHRYYYLNIVNDMYFYDFDTTKVIRITGGMPHSGELGSLQYFESTKKYRYHISDNETFNRLLPECDFYYELTKYGKERVIAQYNGKFFRYEDFNYLMREMGKGELPQIAKTKILAQWRLWMFDQDVHIMSMDTVEHRIPGKKYQLKNSSDSLIYRGNYYLKYQGDIEINGSALMYILIFRGSEKTPSVLTIRNANISVSPYYINVYESRDRSSNILLKENGVDVNPRTQSDKHVYYYTCDESISLIVKNVVNVGDDVKLRFYKSIGPDESYIPTLHTYETPVKTMTNDGAVFQLLNTDVPSGMYLIKYEDQFGNWNFIENVVLIPEEIDATHTIAGTNFTLEIHYLEQSFDSEVDMNLYVSQMKPTFDEVMEKWTGNYQK